jgi:hypothetical protein
MGNPTPIFLCRYQAYWSPLITTGHRACPHVLGIFDLALRMSLFIPQPRSSASRSRSFLHAFRFQCFLQFCRRTKIICNSVFRLVGRDSVPAWSCHRSEIHFRFYFTVINATGTPDSILWAVIVWTAIRNHDLAR